MAAPASALPPPHTLQSPRTTTAADFRRSRRRQLGGGRVRRLRAPSQNKCSSCGLRKIKETGHRLLVKASGERVGYCPALAKHKSPEEWLDSLQ
ncbi:hypothetical protein CesoFtcFv8_019409 [Champsocephalus esox]|uniref:Uncharacterized protein n=1 Tax=Champsocephalus esox TaxID=159716 RepID=A0AAN8BDW3_9TELE|nr:hypothetical protein CesoFtcFv8_019409 [Champsocephalus esox]